MKSSNNLIPTLFKAAILALVLFWILIFSEKMLAESYIFMLCIVSIIPISIVSTLVVLITILPLYSLEKEKLSNLEIFKKYFPYYAITLFGTCIYLIALSNFEKIVIAFCITAFFTLMQSWVWICKPVIASKKNINETKNQ